MRRTALIAALVSIAVLACGGAWAEDYITDTVDPLAPYMQDLEHVYSLGIIEGYRDDTFRPDQITERAELWVAFNRLVTVCRMQGMELPEDYEPYLATYGRGVRDHWGMEAWERMIRTYLADRPHLLPLIMEFDGKIKRIEFAEYAVAVMRAYGVIPVDLTPAEIAVGEGIMVVQPDGKIHFQELMPRWEMAVGLSRLVRRLAPDL